MVYVQIFPTVASLPFICNWGEDQGSSEGGNTIFDCFHVLSPLATRTVSFLCKILPSPFLPSHLPLLSSSPPFHLHLLLLLLESPKQLFHTMSHSLCLFDCSFMIRFRLHSFGKSTTFFCPVHFSILVQLLRRPMMSL